jgi:hypothetical protein
LRQLTEQAKDKVKLDDLVGFDKQNLLLLFLENKEVQTKILESIFPKRSRSPSPSAKTL